MALITPMRAADLCGDVNLILPHHYPVVLSPKFDGYRATTQPSPGPIAQAGMRDIIVWSKNNKPIPNAYVQRCLNHWSFTMLDGELIVGSPTEPGSLQRTSSGVTTRSGEPDFNFWVFDDLARLDLPFISRLARLEARFKKQLRDSRVRLVPHKIVLNVKELIAYESKCVAEGWEGVMVRARDGDYKQGGAEPRSTVKELFVAKLKRVEHHEARVLSVYEEMKNTNEATRDEIGRTKRSTAKAGKVGKGTLGGCIVEGISGRWKGVTYDVGGGWTAPQRLELWETHLDAKTHSKTQPVVGRIMKVETGITPPTFKKPQFPRFVDWKWGGDL
jgi:DNA ligase-1